MLETWIYNEFSLVNTEEETNYDIEKLNMASIEITIDEMFFDIRTLNNIMNSINLWQHGITKWINTKGLNLSREHEGHATCIQQYTFCKGPCFNQDFPNVGTLRKFIVYQFGVRGIVLKTNDIKINKANDKLYKKDKNILVRVYLHLNPLGATLM